MRRQDAERSDLSRELLRMDTKTELLEARMNTHDIVHAGASGELRGIRRSLRVGFAFLALLVTAFGGTALYLAAGR